MTNQVVVKPIGTRIIASKVDEGEVTTQSGIIMPDTAKGDELVAYRIESVSDMIHDSKAFHVGQIIFIPRATPTARMKTLENKELDLFDTTYVVAKVTGNV